MDLSGWAKLFLKYFSYRVSTRLYPGELACSRVPYGCEVPANGRAETHDASCNGFLVNLQKKGNAPLGISFGKQPKYHLIEMPLSLSKVDFIASVGKLFIARNAVKPLYFQAIAWSCVGSFAPDFFCRFAVRTGKHEWNSFFLGGGHLLTRKFDEG